MKKFLILLLSLETACLGAAPGSDKDKDKNKDSKDAVMVLHGAIEDSQCAFNVHSESRSHEWMIKKGVPGAHDEKSCTQHCVKDMGGLYVLVVKDDVYRLDDQILPEQFAGKMVKVTATQDAKPHTLRVLKIEEDK
ncbi:MAG TPA: hypothetical protein VKW06_02425 [Candidatus Angelobacter sp.]|nr:hypothetical protein [Candidatus Angelobacter sp.]